MVSITDLVTAAKVQQRLEEEILQLEEALGQAKKTWTKQAQEIIPNMMAELEIANFELADGYKISIKDKIQAKIPENMFADAIIWLREHDLDGIVKSQVSVDFGKGQDEELQALVTKLEAFGIAPRVKYDIHHMTLKAFVKEQLEKGTGIPLEVFGAFVVRESTITAPK